MRLLVSGNWCSTSISTFPRPADMRSAASIGSDARHDLASPSLGRLPVVASMRAIICSIALFDSNND